MPICAYLETVNSAQMAAALSGLSYIAQMEFPLNFYSKKVTLSREGRAVCARKPEVMK